MHINNRSSFMNGKRRNQSRIGGNLYSVSNFRRGDSSIKLTKKTFRKVKVNPQQAEVAQGFQGRLRPRIFLTFGTTSVVGRQPYAQAAFNPGEIPGTNFQRLSRPQDTWFRRSHGKNSQRHHRESITGLSD